MIQQKILAASKPIHCSGNNNNNTPVLDDTWTTFVASATKDPLSFYIIYFNLCSTRIIPGIFVKKKVKEYENICFSLPTFKSISRSIDQGDKRFSSESRGFYKPNSALIRPTANLLKYSQL